MKTVDEFLQSGPHKFLVTGAAGFIASNLCLKLLKSGQQVMAIDDFSTGLKQNIEELIKVADEFKDTGASFEFDRVDITDLEKVTGAAKGIDYILHQAALGSVPRSIESPWLSHEANVNGTLKVFLAAQRAQVKRVIFASSSSVYGDTLIRPNVEGSEGEPLSPYAVTKKIAELYAKNFSKVYDQEIIGLRYFNVFGPRQNPNSRYAAVIPLFIKAFLSKQAPTIYGDGQHSRDFTYVDNVVEGNLLACFASKKFSGEVINVACSETHSLNSLVEALSEISGSNIKAQHVEPRAGDIAFSQANIDRAKSALNYHPRVGFKEGLKKTYEWFQQQESLG